MLRWEDDGEFVLNGYSGKEIIAVVRFLSYEDNKERQYEVIFSLLGLDRCEEEHGFGYFPNQETAKAAAEAAFKKWLDEAGLIVRPEWPGKG